MADKKRIIIEVDEDVHDEIRSQVTEYIGDMWADDVEKGRIAVLSEDAE